MTLFLSAIGAALVWSATEALLALTLWPLCRGSLPAGLAWGMARLAAPHAVAYLVLAPATLLGRMPFAPATIAAAAVGLALIAWLPGRDRPRARVLYEDRHECLRFEAFYAVFLVAAALFAPFEAGMIDMGERVRDSHVWTSLWAHAEYPLVDPAFGGLILRHYVFGWYSLATVALLTGLEPLTAYTMAMTVTFAHYAAALYLVVIAVAGEKSRKLGWLAAAGIACASNGASLRQAWDTLVNGTPYNWWNVSRVITNAIDEFPLWSFTLGDLHPHFMVLPLLPMLVALCVRYVVAPGPSLAVGGAFLTALVWGGNTWELPVFVVLAALTALATIPRYGRTRTAAGLATYAVVTLVLALPFLRYKTQMPLAIGVVTARSSCGELMAAVGLFLLPLLARPLVRHGRDERAQWLWGLVLFLAVGIISNATLLFVLAWLAFLAASALLEERFTSAWYSALFGFLGMGIVLVCELVYLKDIYGNEMARMNTIFKLYMPVWTLLGIGAALALAELWHDLSPSPLRWLPAGWAALFLAHLAFGLPARTGGLQGVTALDGLGHLAHRWPDDAALIRWMQPRVRDGRLRGRLLEAVGGGFSWYDRLGAATGIETYVGWEGHGITTYGHNNNPEIGRRFDLAKKIWSGELAAPCDRLRKTLEREQIRYVAIAGLEREKVPADAIGKIEACLTPVHREGSAVLFGLASAPGG